MKHRYLFTLEITPLEVGKTYDKLPSHLTLMSRFFSELSPEELTEKVAPLFRSATPIELKFGETTKLGPKELTVHMVDNTDQLKELHNNLKTLLGSLNVEYEYPQFTGDNHRPHVTWREGDNIKAGDTKTSIATYLIEVVDGKRVIRSKLNISVLL